ARLQIAARALTLDPRGVVRQPPRGLDLGSHVRQLMADVRLLLRKYLVSRRITNSRAADQPYHSVFPAEGVTWLSHHLHHAGGSSEAESHSVEDHGHVRVCGEATMSQYESDSYEVFRRAILDRDEEAWAIIYSRYRSLLIAWAARSTVRTHQYAECADIAD